MLTSNPLFLAGIFLLGMGVFFMLASKYNWDFFFEARKTKMLASWMGSRERVRNFYTVVGLLFVGAGVFLLFFPEPALNAWLKLMG